MPNLQEVANYINHLVAIYDRPGVGPSGFDTDLWKLVELAMKAQSAIDARQ